MAIQVNGTEVISNSRALNNIASIDATTAAAIGAGGVGAPTAQSWVGGLAVGEMAGNINPYNMVYENNRFVMTRAIGSIYWSDDGVTWNVGNYASVNQILTDVTYVSGSTWLAVGDSGTILRSTNNAVSWSSISSPTTGGYISGVVSNGSRVVISALSSRGLWYSDNAGTSWTQVSGTSGWSFDGIGYGNSRFMAVRRDAGFSYSDNGSSFTNVANSQVSTGSNFGVAGPSYGDGRWLYTFGGGRCQTSTNNGVSWSTVSTGTSYGLKKCHYANGAWVAVGEYSTILKADTGVSFVQVPPPFTNNSPYYSGVTYGNGKWVTAIQAPPAVASST